MRKDISELKIIGETVTITLQDLVDVENLQTPIIDPRNNKEISLTTTVEIEVQIRGKFAIDIGTIIYEE